MQILLEASLNLGTFDTNVLITYDMNPKQRWAHKYYKDSNAKGVSMSWSHHY